MTVSGGESLEQDLLADLRETQAGLEAARAEIASLKVLLALRTHQYQEAWQAEQRCAAEREAERVAADAQAAEREATWARETAAARERATAQADAARAEAVARADARTEALRTVLSAVLGSLRFWGLNRRRFQRLIVQAGRDAADVGPDSERHTILLVEARRILGHAE